MTNYILMTIGGFGYLIYIILFSKVSSGQILPRSEYYDLIAPMLLSISAGLFISNKSKGAGIFGLLGIGIASTDILSSWLILDLVIQTKYLIQFLFLTTLTNIYLFLLGFISIKAILKTDINDKYEINSKHSKSSILKIISIIPIVIIVIATVSWLTIIRSK